jgi:hypothetical protein
MSEAEEIAARLTRDLSRASALRAAAAADPALEAARQRLRAWQAVRLARTHADLLASPSMGLAATFFLTDLYGSEDLTRLDADVRRILPGLKRLMSAAGLETVAQAIELEALSEELDFAMAALLADKSRELSAASYAAAYRAIGRRGDRERQIALVESLGRSLERLVHRHFTGATLAMMRKPARLAGLGELHDFLERGYKAFTRMGAAGEFLELIVGRERKVLEAVFAGDDRLLGD